MTPSDAAARRETRTREAIPAPPWRVTEWFNTDRAISLAELRGRVIVLHAFQMLCPGCVVHGLPQAQRIRDVFGAEDVAVIGLHTVFEHHAAMTPAVLAAFIHEYRLTFPIGVDEPADAEGVPQTMRAYGMRGTPTLVLIDRAGFIRKHGFGREDDMTLGAEIAALVCERPLPSRAAAPPADLSAGVCDPDGCEPPTAGDALSRRPAS